MNTSIGNFSTQSLLQSSEVINAIVVAIIIFVVGLILGRVAGKFIERLLREFQVDKTVKNKIGVSTSVQRMVGGIVSFSIYFVFAIIALNYVGITSLLLNVLSIVVILVLFISAILSLKDALPNILAYTQIRKNVKEGDVIAVKTVEGTVQKINLLATVITTKQGDEILIPNVLFLKETHIKRAKKKSKT
jgi:small-conductance mechanosensitive channel